MGPGGSQEAEFDLVASVPAGAYRLVCDSIVIHPIDVTFDLVWRRAGDDTLLATHTRRFERRSDGRLVAQPCEIDLEAPAIDFEPGDQLIWRYAGANSDTTVTMPWIPNGDGERTEGRIPNLTLPR